MYLFYLQNRDWILEFHCTIAVSGGLNYKQANKTQKTITKIKKIMNLRIIQSFFSTWGFWRTIFWWNNFSNLASWKLDNLLNVRLG